MAPLFSLRAKGKIGKDFQIQPLQYSKAPDAKVGAEEYQYEVKWVDDKPSGVFDFFLPGVSGIGEKCEIWRHFKICPVEQDTGLRGCGCIGDFDKRMECVGKVIARENYFKAIRELWNNLTQDEKTSWEVFGMQFNKHDICVLAVTAVTAFHVFMSFNMILAFARGLVARFAPVMTTQVSTEAALRGWKATHWYYVMKKAQLRRAWVLFRKRKYTIKQVMKITEVWKKYKKWALIKRPYIEKMADDYYQGPLDNIENIMRTFGIPYRYFRPHGY